MSQTKPTSKHFLGVLMASGIVMVGGFLLLVEAVFFLNIDWCVLPCAPAPPLALTRPGTMQSVAATAMPAAATS